MFVMRKLFYDIMTNILNKDIVAILLVFFFAGEQILAQKSEVKQQHGVSKIEDSKTNSKKSKRNLWGSIADNSVGELTNITALRTNYSKLLLSWRMLPNDTEETKFDIYHKSVSGWDKMNKEPIANTTNFQVPDKYVDQSVENTYKLCYQGSDVTLDLYTISADQLMNKKPYVSIFLQETASDPRINDARDADDGYVGQGNHQLAVADVDGDGLDEITYGACALDHDGTGLYTMGYYLGSDLIKE